MQLQCQGTLGGEICQRPQCWFYRNGLGLVSADVEGGANRYHAILGNQGLAKFVNSSRIAPALISLGAQLRVIGPEEGAEQFIAVEDLFRVPKGEDDRLLALAPGQFVTHVILPPIAGRTCATYEVRHGEGPDYPLAASSVALRMDAFGVVREAKITLGHVAPTPWVAHEAARMLVGHRVDVSRAEMAGAAAVALAIPMSENEYKVQLAKTAVKRAILLAAGLETGGF
jgi:xanthine dehydrogenase YagS FAD-binding subunit